MFAATSVLLLGCQVSVVPALSVNRASVGLHGHRQGEKSGSLSFLSLEQAPGPKPAYVTYGEPEFTTFNNITTACQACVEFWPDKEDGKRFHSSLYTDGDGGVWERSCRAGKCDFRDPQVDPVGGVIGQGTGPNRKPDGKTCITRDPVQWFSDCEPVLLESTHSLLDATRYCSYREQIFIPPPDGAVSRFSGKPEAWTRIGGSHEQCLTTIEKEGSALFDTATFCDSNLPALSGCCESIFSALSCVAETSSRVGGNPQGIFATMGSEGAQMLESFSKYCVPLCQNTKEEFCAKFPSADVCMKPKECTDCTKIGGLWCPKLESCHCPSKNPPCIAPPITTPLQCLGDDDGKRRFAPSAKDDGGKGNGGAGGDGDGKLCKYKDMARTWAQRE